MLLYFPQGLEVYCRENCMVKHLLLIFKVNWFYTGQYLCESELDIYGLIFLVVRKKTCSSFSVFFSLTKLHQFLLNTNGLGLFVVKITQLTNTTGLQHTNNSHSLSLLTRHNLTSSSPCSYHRGIVIPCVLYSHLLSSPGHYAEWELYRTELTVKYFFDDSRTE